MEKTVLGIFAHPDDAEFLCGGTLSLLSKAGWKVHIATMTAGDKGTAWHNREEIISIRIKEATNAAQLIGARYHCLGLEDVYILYDRVSINKTTALVRNIRPIVVFTCSPADYMVDHEMASLITQTACFSSGIKNMEINEPVYDYVPYLYYCDPMESKDKLGNMVYPSIYVDISGEMQIKEQILACHESQRNWLREHHKMDEYLLSMKRFSEQQGKKIDVGYAEGFRQNLGHGYPQDNILGEFLGDKVYIRKTDKASI
jgi:LmbE family N-acetylglucosaminyl deacetylase